MTVARAIAVLVLLMVPGVARAHFVLQAPPSATEQATSGDPQKAPPCGGGTATGVVTPFQAGQTITITINETITHPGHYRVALSATGPAGLPAEPPVTAGTSDCGSTTIMNPAVYPVLADGQLLHTAAFSGPQSFQVTLPTNVTCTKCTLQVIEFMSQHGLNVPGGCFYHHCADISIAAATGTGGAAGGTTGAGGSGGSGVDGGTPGGSDSGCGCGVGDLVTPSWLTIFAVLVAVVLVRRRNSQAAVVARARRTPSSGARN